MPNEKLKFSLAEFPTAGWENDLDQVSIASEDSGTSVTAARVLYRTYFACRISAGKADGGVMESD